MTMQTDGPGPGGPRREAGDGLGMTAALGVGTAGAGATVRHPDGASLTRPDGSTALRSDGETVVRPDASAPVADVPPEDLLLEPESQVVAAGATEERPLGRQGDSLNKESPFFVGLYAALGVGVAYVLARAVTGARDVLILIGLAFFLAVGLDPAVRWLQGRGLSRGLAVTAVILVTLGVVGGFLAAAIPPLASQATSFANHSPQYVQELKDRNSTIGSLNARYHILDRLTTALKSGGGSGVAGDVLGAGKVVLTAVSSTLIVVVLTVYFLADLARIKVFLLRLAPRSRRARVGLISEEVFARVGGYVLGNAVTSVIAGLGTLVWLEVFRVPYAALLACFIAIVDLVPVVGSTVGGLVVSLVALTVSLPVALATLGFYVVYRLLEDYLITPRIMGRTVDVPGVVTVVAVLLGGTLLGVVGALVAIPVAAAIRLFLDEAVYPTLDAS